MGHLKINEIQKRIFLNWFKSIDHKFLLSGLSFLANNSDFGVIGMALVKNNLMYALQDFYETIKTERVTNLYSAIHFVVSKVWDWNSTSGKLTCDTKFFLFS